MADAEKLTEAGRVLSRRDIDRMVAFLGSQAFRLSHREPGQVGLPQHEQPLRHDVELFARLWHQLEAVLREILAHPAEALVPETREVHLRGRYRPSAPALARNLREGRVLADPDGRGWRPLGESLWGTVDAPTRDTPENAHVHAVAAAYCEVRESLRLALEEEHRGHVLEAERKRRYGSEPRRVRLFEGLAGQAARGLALLGDLPESTLPAAWADFRSSPSRHTNRALFDPRYRAVAELEDELDRLLTAGFSPDARRRLAELGERRPWELYEYWMVAKACALLEDLRFVPDDPAGFAALEHARGGTYGLRHGAALTYTHRTAGLAIRLTVQNDQAEGQRTDLQLEFVAGLDGRPVPLVLDAKCKAYGHAGHPELAADLQDSARRYVRDNGGSAFLLHPHTLRAWPARSAARQPFLEDGDFPFRHGVERLHPDDDRSLRRILSAWFVRHGLFRICPSCGNDHRGGVQRLARYEPPDFHGRYPLLPPAGSHGWVCADEDCRIGTVLNRCLACKRLIVKVFPTAAAVHRDNAEWLDHVEVYAPDTRRRAGLRHCASCGETL